MIFDGNTYLLGKWVDAPPIPLLLVYLLLFSGIMVMVDSCGGQIYTISSAELAAFRAEFEFRSATGQTRTTPGGAASSSTRPVTAAVGAASNDDEATAAV